MQLLPLTLRTVSGRVEEVYQLLLGLLQMLLRSVEVLFCVIELLSCFGSFCQAQIQCAHKTNDD